MLNRNPAGGFIPWIIERLRAVDWLLVAAAGIITAARFATMSSFGGRGWFDFGVFFFQPAGLATLSLILILSKYFERRHVEIAHFRHILISAIYALLIVGLILLQPDFGSAMIAVAVWVGMILLSGISKKHLLAVFLTAALVAGSLWVYVFKDYQKQRITSFVYPMADIQGSGYNAFQSTVAVGSGGLFGKGIGYGTQS